MNEWVELSDKNGYTLNLGELFKLLFRHIEVILFAVILLGGGAFVYATVFVTPLYQSTVKMYVNNSASDTTNISSSDISAAQSLVDTYVVVLTSKPTIEAVIEQTGVDYTYSELCSMISTSAVNDTEVLCITVTGPDSVEAAAIANAIAEIAPDEIMEIVTGSSVKIVEYASVATDKSSPNQIRYALIGAVLGFFLSCAGIMVFSLLRNGMSVEDKIRRDFKNKPILSAIPWMGEKKKNRRGKNRSVKDDGAELCEDLNFASAESYKLLRENIAFCFSDVSNCRVIGVTSSMRAEGKTTTAINLAYTLALANKKVCLIDCDFRLPSVAKRLKLHRRPGVTNLLTSQVEGAEIMQYHKSEAGKFYVITAGDIPPNPSELLGSIRMQELLKTLEKSFDYLVLDLPPVGMVSDALTVTKMIDGMLFVAREDCYERRIMSESMRMLEGVNTKIIGIVVTCSTTQQKEYKHYGGKYGYRYGYGYGYGEENDSVEKHDNRISTD